MRAVVFDFDGVLCRSMHLHVQAYREVLEPLGVPVGDAAVYQLEGARSETIIRELAAQAQVEVADVAELADQKQAAFQRLVPPALYPGTEELVRAIQARTQTAVVTGTRKENLRRLLGDLRGGFDALLSQESYEHDKPHPEPYARAAQAIGRQPQDCIAVENAPRGVRSAKAAGYGLVIGITTTVSKDVLHEADEVVESHTALQDLLVAQLERQRL